MQHPQICKNNPNMGCFETPKSIIHDQKTYSNSKLFIFQEYCKSAFYQGYFCRFKGAKFIFTSLDIKIWKKLSTKCLLSQKQLFSVYIEKILLKRAVFAISGIFHPLTVGFMISDQSKLKQIKLPGTPTQTPYLHFNCIVGFHDN